MPDDPIQWMPRKHNKVADGLADYTMDTGASWSKTFPVQLNLLRANIIVQTDGGKRGGVCAAASVVIGLFTMCDGNMIYEPFYAEGIFLTGAVSVFQAEAIAVESGARKLSQMVGAAVRDLT